MQNQKQNDEKLNLSESRGNLSKQKKEVKQAIKDNETNNERKLNNIHKKMKPRKTKHLFYQDRTPHAKTYMLLDALTVNCSDGKFIETYVYIYIYMSRPL